MPSMLSRFLLDVFDISSTKYVLDILLSLWVRYVTLYNLLVGSYQTQHTSRCCYCGRIISPYVWVGQKISGICCLQQYIVILVCTVPLFLHIITIIFKAVNSPGHKLLYAQSAV
jgi:hypothetical protein